MEDYGKEFCKIVRENKPFFVFGSVLIFLIYLSSFMFRNIAILQPGFILGGSLAIVVIAATSWYMLSHGYKFVGFKVWEKA